MKFRHFMVIWCFSMCLHCACKQNANFFFVLCLQRYFVNKIVLTYCEKNCSSDWEKLLKFVAEGRVFANFLRSLEQFIQTFKNGRFKNGRLFLGELRPRKNAFEVFWPLANILKLFIYFLGYMGGNTPTQGSSRNTPMSGQNTPRRTPRGQFDTTPLYDE